MKNIDERLSALQKKKDELAQKRAKIVQQEKKLKAVKSKKERNARTKRLVELGARLEKKFPSHLIETVLNLNEHRMKSIFEWLEQVRKADEPAGEEKAE